MRNIILLTGFAGSGKTTIAEYLADRHGFARVRFAEPLKQMLAALGLTHSELDGPLKSEPCATLCGQTPRVAMQTLGTEWGRNLIHPHLWIRAWQGRVRSTLRDVVCDDCRFDNEIGAAKEIERSRVTVIRLERDGAHAVNGIAGHPSERIIPFDHRIVNNSTVRMAVEHVLNVTMDREFRDAA